MTLALILGAFIAAGCIVALAFCRAAAAGDAAVERWRREGGAQ